MQAWAGTPSAKLRVVREQSGWGQRARKGAKYRRMRRKPHSVWFDLD
ncbi:MAG: hypothetical protein AAGC79_13605 [Pseudomonadota bacterium]